MSDSFSPLGGSCLGTVRGHGIDKRKGFIQVPDTGADHLAVLLHLVEDHQLGFHRGAELAVDLPRHREGQARRQETASAGPMRGIAFGREPWRHDRHQPPARCQTLCSRDEMFRGDVLVSRAIDRGGEGRIHYHDVGQNRRLQQIIDMLAVMACDLAAENRAQEALAKGVDLVEQKRGTGPGGDSGQGTGARAAIAARAPVPAEGSSTVSPLRMAAARTTIAAKGNGVENCCNRICCSDRRVSVSSRKASSFAASMSPEAPSPRSST